MIAALAAVLAVALIAASTAHALSTCTLNGSSLTGTTGNDVMCGTSQSDTMDGNSGNDVLFGNGLNDFLSGGEGDDTVDGGLSNDTLIGEAGFDRLVGGSGNGNDQLLFRDGSQDADMNRRGGPSCGSGTDSMDIDLVDARVLAATNHIVGGPLLFLGGDCENVTVGAINEGPNVVISRRSLSVGTDGRAAVRLRCPASLTAPCAGELRIGRTKNSVGTPKAYSIDQGKKEDVSARLSQRVRNKLSQRGRITALVTSVEQGQFGEKTTVQTIKLIAQD
jgi:hypothetical protein